VFVGTVNPNDFVLPSADENRRYWCVVVEAPVDTRRLEADRDQIWAEAVAAYAAGHGADGEANDYLWWLSPEEETMARTLAGEKTSPSAFKERIWKWWNRMPIDARPEDITAEDIIDKLMLQHNDDPRKIHALTTEIGLALRQLGFKSKRERRGKPARMVTVYFPKREHLEHVDNTPAQNIGATVHDIAERRKANGT
jgi:predicted P-loop ATPase